MGDTDFVSGDFSDLRPEFRFAVNLKSETLFANRAGVPPKGVKESSGAQAAPE
ncbi:MAG: hypothetical protein V9H26_16490 [Verrucomicrobiota bacterium]